MGAELENSTRLKGNTRAKKWQQTCTGFCNGTPLSTLCPVGLVSPVTAKYGVLCQQRLHSHLGERMLKKLRFIFFLFFSFFLWSNAISY